MNTIINTLPNTIPTAHVISSSGCTDQADNAHFDSEGYRKLGRRYAVKMLSLMGYEANYSEAECSTVGENWIIRGDNNASNASYVTTMPDIENLTTAPSNDSSVIEMNFTVSSDTSYYVYGRFNNPTISSDSYWVKIDGDSYELFDNLTTTGWQWLPIKNYDLTTGNHTICVAIAENGGKIDKIAIKNSQISPADVGEEANIVCIPEISTLGIESPSASGYALNQNFPNPCTESTSITFEIPKTTYVSLQVFNSQGIEVAQLAGKDYNAGKHTIKYNLKKLPTGNYYYTMKTDSFSETRNMIIVGK